MDVKNKYLEYVIIIALAILFIQVLTLVFIRMFYEAKMFIYIISLLLRYFGVIFILIFTVEFLREKGIKPFSKIPF
ncbi:hypothetical protein D6745_04405 [Candidatus Woesearchaeota archaeon]|nr:MAG: hypothetical protein D6745_04405 [Candidatus Woesearchaeota archaeon]